MRLSGGLVLPLLGNLAQGDVDLRERGVVAVGLVRFRELFERRDVVGIGRQNRVEKLDRVRRLLLRESRLHGRSDRRHRAVVRALLDAEIAEEHPRRLGIGVELERLLRRPDGLGALPHLELGLGKEREAVRRPGSGLQDGHGRIGVVLGEKRADEVLLRLDVVGRELQGLLKDLGGFVVRPPLEEHVADQAVLHDGLVLLVGGAVQVGQADLNLYVRRIDRRHLLVHADGIRHPVVLLVVVGEDLVLAPGVLDQPLLVVEVGQLVVDLELGGVDLVDLLEDRDRLQEEAVLGVEVGDPGEIGDRVPRPVHPDVEVPHLVQGRDVLGVVLQDAEVFLQRLIELTLGQQLLGGLKDLFAVDRHVLVLILTATAHGPAFDHRFRGLRDDAVIGQTVLFAGPAEA